MVRSDILRMSRYPRYVLIGVFVGILTVALHEAIADLLPADTPTYYLLSISLAYAFGIILSFLLQHAFTFKLSSIHRKWHMFTSFIVVALIGAASTSLLAMFFRYLLGLDLLLGKLSASIAFAAATCTSSILTYWLNARFVFKV
jgi:putative flippase GtrA